MKFNMKTDLWVKILLWGCILMFVPLFFTVDPSELWILALSTFIMALIIIPLFRSYYELTDDAIVIHMYFFKSRIKYDSIKSLKLCKNWYSSAAMSSERIEIKQHGKGKMLGTTYISPEPREEFYSQLKLYCRNLEGFEDNPELWDTDLNN